MDNAANRVAHIQGALFCQAQLACALYHLDVLNETTKWETSVNLKGFRPVTDMTSWPASGIRHSLQGDGLDQSPLGLSFKYMCGAAQLHSVNAAETRWACANGRFRHALLEACGK